MVGPMLCLRSVVSYVTWEADQGLCISYWSVYTSCVCVCVCVCVFTDMSALGNRVNGLCGSDLMAHLARSLRLEEEGQVRHDITFMSLLHTSYSPLFYIKHICSTFFFSTFKMRIPFLLSPRPEIPLRKPFLCLILLMLGNKRSGTNGYLDFISCTSLVPMFRCVWLPWIRIRVKGMRAEATYLLNLHNLVHCLEKHLNYCQVVISNNRGKQTIAVQGSMWRQYLSLL